MKKRLGMFATLIAALFAVIQPAAAQDRYDWNRGHEDRDRNHYADDRYRRDRDWRADRYRDDARRDREFREHEWREHERFDRYGYGYRVPPPAFGFQYYGRY